jgi:BioD-like phosphotransacetylase family protein
LSDDIQPSQALMEEIDESPLSVVSSPLDSYSIATRILSMNVKTLPDDLEKIARIQDLVSAHVNVARLLEKIGLPNPRFS